MRIACPNCHALYDVPDNLLGGRTRRLRCEQCGHGWEFAPDGQEEAAAPPAEDLPSEDLTGHAAGEALGRRFGQPSDEEAKAEIRAALQDEALARPYQENAAPDIAAQPEPDRFADLVRAARNNEMELEPDKGRRKQARTANPRLISLLLLLLVLALIVVDRHAVMRAIPASAKLFQALHLS